MRYVESSAALVNKPDERLVNSKYTGDSTYDQKVGGRAVEENGIGSGAHGERDGRTTGNTAGNSSGRTARSDGRRPFLNVGFIGHDFDEHPTAHMVEGVFVWQRRLARMRHERDGAVKTPETRGTTSNSGDRLITSLATPVADCCR